MPNGNAEQRHSEVKLGSAKAWQRLAIHSDAMAGLGTATRSKGKVEMTKSKDELAELARHRIATPTVTEMSIRVQVPYSSPRLSLWRHSLVVKCQLVTLMSGVQFSLSPFFELMMF